MVRRVASVATGGPLGESPPQPVITSNALLTRQTSTLAYPVLIGSLLSDERVMTGPARKGSLPYIDESGRSGCSGSKKRRPRYGE
jgi:hypothetical protein